MSPGRALKSRESGDSSKIINSAAGGRLPVVCRMACHAVVASWPDSFRRRSAALKRASRSWIGIARTLATSRLSTALLSLLNSSQR